MVHIAFNDDGIYIIDSQGTLITIPRASTFTEHTNITYKLAMSPDFQVVKFEDISKVIKEVKS